MSAQKELPGNIGDGINSDANTNNKKKAIMIMAPLILNYLLEGVLDMFCFLSGSPKYLISRYLISFVVYLFNMNTETGLENRYNRE